MQYEEFLAQMQTCIEQIAGEEYEVQLHSIIKNNDVEQNGIVLMKKGERVSPTIYLNAYYDRYLEGETIHILCNEILELRITTMQDNALDTLTENMELSEWKDKIIYRLVNRRSNQRRLMNAPFMQFMDLAITFHCLVRSNEEGIGSFLVTRELMEQWNLNVKELYQIASVNTPKLFPVRINTMEEILQELMQVDGLFDMPLSLTDGAKPMYILTNASGINGATTLLYPNVIENFSNQINSNIYILPSSIHEVILVPNQDNLDKSQLIQMVNEVNQTQVAKEEVLSSGVYYYDRECKQITA